jgi:cellulose synthase (UDP-forming)
MKKQTPFEDIEPSRKCLVVTYLVVAVWYLAWRITTFNQDALLFSLLLYGAEVYGFFTTLMHIFMTWRLTVRTPLKAPSGKIVDVFIPTYNEPVSLLRKTLLAANNMNYRHQTWLLDDGKRPEMEALAKELGVRYLTRATNEHAKAGNLNNALRYSTAEFIAIFDADHAPKKDFIVNTLGFFDDDEVALVQTPQDFYNLDSFQHHKKNGTAVAWHEQTVFFRVIQRGKDYWNAAFFCGSCAIVKRSSLDAIGGFAVGTVTEDLHTSIKLHKKGFRTVFYPEPLAFGLAPSGIEPFLNQRIRWGQGAMQVWRQEGVLFSRGLTLAQKINYIASTITYFDGWQKGLYYLVPAIVLATGVMPLITFGPDFFKHFIPYFLLTFWVFEEVNRGYGRSVIIEQYNMARFAAMAWSTLGLFKKNISFQVTPKTFTATSKGTTYILPQLLVLLLNVSAVLVGIFLYFTYHHLPASGMLANVIWSFVNIALAISITLFVRAYSRFKRSDYRFPIPLPAALEFSDGNKFYGVIDDISSSGFRMYSSLPDSVTVNMPVSGSIYLPSGPIPFSASIKALIKGKSGQQEYIKAVGCTFHWSEHSVQDRLSLFLYGSDMQLTLNSLSENIQTPLSWLAEKLSGKKSRSEDLACHWNTIVFSISGSTEKLAGLISTADPKTTTPQKLLSFKSVPSGSQIKLGIYSRQGMTIQHGTIGTGQQMDTPVSPFYIYSFSPDNVEVVP